MKKHKVKKPQAPRLNGMPEDARMTIYSRLMKKRQEILGTEREVERVERGEGGGESAGEIAHVRLHDADLGTDESIREISERLTKKELEEVAQIEDALVRLERGIYGSCQECGERIGEERLAVLPEAAYCLDCEEAKESKAARRAHNLGTTESADLYTENYSRKKFQ